MRYADKLRHPEWQKKRLSILNRDNFTCILCGDSQTELHVHHKYYAPNTEPWQYEDNAFVTLCKHCHCIIEAFKKKYQHFTEVVRLIKIQHDITGFVQFFMRCKKGYVHMMAINLKTDEVEDIILFSPECQSKLSDFLNKKPVPNGQN